MGTAQSTADPRLDVRADRLQEGASGGGQPPLNGAANTSIRTAAAISRQGAAAATSRQGAAAAISRQGAAAGACWPEETGNRPAAEVAHLRKSYGELVAVDDVSFSVAQGEIFGILGPNGAGKTTTVECAIGLRSPDSGTVRLLGLDPQADRDRVHEVVGVQLQAGALPAKLRVGEILHMYRSFYPDPADVGELTEALGLASKLKDYYKSLSGGQQQRLSVALALIGRPKIAVLDEMTTGLDPQARRDAWALIEGIRGRGVTIVLVTHFMEEAERLCDRVALIDGGRIVALDTPARLAARARGGKTVRFVPSAPFDDRLLTGLGEVTKVEREGQHVIVTGTGTGELVNAVILALATAGVTARDVQLDSSSLEDAFVKLTGNRPDQEGAAQ
jgi:ABC-2 type transport system ATP-binding protein